MNTAPQELLKEYVQIQHFTSTAEIMRAMKEMFRDVLQTVMEAEMDEELGRERCQSAETSGCPGIGTGASSRRSSEIQPERGRDGGEYTGAVLLRDEPAGHRGADQRII